MTPYRDLMEDGELPADILEQYPVAQDKPRVKPSPPVPKHRPWPQELNHEQPQRRRPVVYLDHNLEPEDWEDWFEGHGDLLIRGFIGMFVMMTACMLCAMWSIYT